MDEHFRSHNEQATQGARRKTGSFVGGSRAFFAVERGSPSEEIEASTFLMSYLGANIGAPSLKVVTLRRDETDAKVARR
jgi:hypothetical protein